MPMSVDQFYDMTQAILVKCVEVMRDKGADYTLQSTNKLANFERQAERNGLKPAKIVDIYAQKHQDAIDSYRVNGTVESEALELRYVDRINYLLLEFACHLVDEKNPYQPREDWLIEALSGIDKAEPLKFPGSVATPSEKADIAAGMAMADAAAERIDKALMPENEPEIHVSGVGEDGAGKIGEACCNPDGDDCCE